MRRPPILPLMLGLSLCGCSDAVDPPADGILAVSTATSGDDPDPDGFQLTIDGTDSLALLPSGTAELALSAGRHTLSLLDVASHCSVTPAATLEVDLSPGSTTPVAFEVTCPLTGVRVAVMTTGLDLDPDGYRLEVDGADRGFAPVNGTVLIRLDPGERIIALIGLGPNCAVEGPASHTVTIADSEVAPTAFAAVCTAVTGVIGVVVAASGTDVGGNHAAWVDGARSFFVPLGGPGYLTRVPAGEHVVSLVPSRTNCSPETDPQTVTVTAGGLIRDTVEVAFSVTCVPRLPATLRIAAPTTGPIPAQSYSVWICKPRYDCIFYPVDWRLLGALAPNDTLSASVEPGRYQLQLRDIPAGCRVRPPFTNLFTVAYSDTREFTFKVACSP